MNKNEQYEVLVSFFMTRPGYKFRIKSSDIIDHMKTCGVVWPNNLSKDIMDSLVDKGVLKLDCDEPFYRSTGNAPENNRHFSIDSLEKVHIFNSLIDFFTCNDGVEDSSLLLENFMMSKGIMWPCEDHTLYFDIMVNNGLLKFKDNKWFHNTINTCCSINPFLFRVNGDSTFAANRDKVIICVEYLIKMRCAVPDRIIQEYNRYFSE